MIKPKKVQTILLRTYGCVLPLSPPFSLVPINSDVHAEAIPPVGLAWIPRALALGSYPILVGYAAKTVQTYHP